MCNEKTLNNEHKTKTTETKRLYEQREGGKQIVLRIIRLIIIIEIIVNNICHPRSQRESHSTFQHDFPSSLGRRRYYVGTLGKCAQIEAPG